MSEVALNLPFSVDSFGKISVTTDQSKIWMDRVRSVAGTTLRERVMRPTFGTLIPYALFETDSTATAQVNTELQKAFNDQLPLLGFVSADVTIDEYTNILTAEVIYTLPNQEVVSTVVGLALINGNNPIYEESL